MSIRSGVDAPDARPDFASCRSRPTRSPDASVKASGRPAPRLGGRARGCRPSVRRTSKSDHSRPTAHIVARPRRRGAELGHEDARRDAGGGRDMRWSPFGDHRRQGASRQRWSGPCRAVRLASAEHVLMLAEQKSQSFRFAAPHLGGERPQRLDDIRDLVALDAPHPCADDAVPRRRPPTTQPRRPA